MTNDYLIDVAKAMAECERKELEILARMEEKERLNARDQADIDAAIKKIAVLKEALMAVDVSRRLNAIYDRADSAGLYEIETADKCYTYWWQFLAQLDRLERSMKRYGCRCDI